MSISGLNLADNQLTCIKSYKRSAESWKTLYNIHETKGLSNIFFIRRKFFTCKMQECDNLLDHVNKVKAFADQLVCLKVPVRDENIVMTLLESLPTLYEYLITVMKTMSMNELTMNYITTRLMHEMSKRKEKWPQWKDVAMMLWQIKDGNSFLHQGAKSCFYYGKSDYIALFLTKQRTRN